MNARTTAILALAAAATLSCRSGCAGLYEEFVNPPREYGEVPFWWWIGDKLDKARLARQLEDLHRKGVAGTQVNYCHLRSGNWRTMPVEPEIFSKEWWDAFAFAVRKSHELGMGIGLSCYTLDWPGPDNLFRQLGITSSETQASVLEKQGDKIVPVRKRDTLDPLNPLSAQRVIDRFFRPFFTHIDEAHHDALDYFFQDELRLAGDERVWSSASGHSSLPAATTSLLSSRGATASSESPATRTTTTGSTAASPATSSSSGRAIPDVSTT